MYNYIGILNKSSAVSKAITCNFLNNTTNKLNLILAKGNIIEIYNITNDGLESTPYLNVYGKIILLEKIPAGVDSHLHNTNIASNYGDSIFILTEDLGFSIVAYNKNKNEVVNLDKGTVKEDIGKRLDKVQAVFEANYEYGVISAYKNIFKIVFLKNRQKNEDFSIRYEYEDLLLLFPLHQEYSSQLVEAFTPNNNNNINKKEGINNTIKILTSKPHHQQTFGMIKVVNTYNSNNIDTKSVKLETFNFNVFKAEVNKDIIFGVDLTNNPTCSLVISPKIGGLVVFFSNYLKYYTCSSQTGYGRIVEKETKTYSDRKFNAYCEIDQFRYLVVDEFGNLFLIAFKQDNSEMGSYNNNNITSSNSNSSSSKYSLVFQFLGEINYASTLTYLDNNYVFVGSEKANSQLIKITKSPTSITIRPFVIVVEEYENLAPISDFTLLNSQSDEGNTEILCVTGDQKSCCLKTIRKGTSINTEAQIPLSGVRDLFSVLFTPNRDSNSMLIDEVDDKLIEKESNNLLMFVNYIDRTNLINFDYNNYSISSYYSDNIYLRECTNFACNFNLNNQNYILQITDSYIITYDETFNLCFKLPTVIKPVINRFKKNKGFLYIYNTNNLLIRYNIFDILNLSKSVDITNSTPEILSDEVLISAFNVSDDMLVYSQWNDNRVCIYSLKTKKTEVMCEYDMSVSCSSIAFLKCDGIKFLFIALSNGKMLYYKLKTSIAKNLPCYTYSKEDFVLKRKYNISNETFNFKKVKCSNKSYLYLNTDLPALLSINKESPSISNFNVKSCLDMTNLPINSQSNLFAFLFKESIHIGGLSNSQSQNIITKHIGKQIYNLTSVSVGGNNMNLTAYTQEERKEDGNISFAFILMDKHLNEVCRFTFENENEVCMTFVEIEESIFNDTSIKLFALGTGIMESKTAEPESGHIYLIEMDENFKLRKCLEQETKGGVYKIASSKNLLYVGICSTLYVYSLTNTNTKNMKEYELQLLRKNNEFTIINDLYCHDNLILVSDVFKSITIFKFDEEKEKLNEVCRDYNPIWCYSTTQIDHNIYIVSDIDGNIFSLRKEVQPRSDEDKFKLERVSQFNLGERINKMVTVSKGIPAKDWELIFANTDKNGIDNFASNSVKNNQVIQTCPVNQIKLTYFGTLEGTFGLIANIPKETYEFLLALQNEILKVISTTGNFEYEKWRAFKDGFVYDFSKGFVEGGILQEFLNFDNSYRIEFLKNMKYPWQRNIKDTISLIESLLKLH